MITVMLIILVKDMVLDVLYLKVKRYLPGQKIPMNSEIDLILRKWRKIVSREEDFRTRAP